MESLALEATPSSIAARDIAVGRSPFAEAGAGEAETCGAGLAAIDVQARYL
jgi:hypothetical protein